MPGQLRSLWFTIEPHVGMPTGEQKIELELLDENSMLLARETLALTVIGMDLPAQGLPLHSGSTATVWPFIMGRTCSVNAIGKSLKTFCALRAVME